MCRQGKDFNSVCSSLSNAEPCAQGLAPEKEERAGTEDQVSNRSQHDGRRKRDVLRYSSEHSSLSVTHSWHCPWWTHLACMAPKDKAGLSMDIPGETPAGGITPHVM